MPWPVHGSLAGWGRCSHGKDSRPNARVGGNEICALGRRDKFRALIRSGLDKGLCCSQIFQRSIADIQLNESGELECLAMPRSSYRNNSQCSSACVCVDTVPAEH